MDRHIKNGMISMGEYGYYKKNGTKEIFNN